MTLTETKERGEVKSTYLHVSHYVKLSLARLVSLLPKTEPTRSVKFLCQLYTSACVCQATG